MSGSPKTKCDSKMAIKKLKKLHANAEKKRLKEQAIERKKVFDQERHDATRRRFVFAATCFDALPDGWLPDINKNLENLIPGINKNLENLIIDFVL